jgi:hypothetical protein
MQLQTFEKGMMCKALLVTACWRLNEETANALQTRLCKLIMQLQPHFASFY